MSDRGDEKSVRSIHKDEYSLIKEIKNVPRIPSEFYTLANRERLNEVASSTTKEVVGGLMKDEKESRNHEAQE